MIDGERENKLLKCQKTFYNIIIQNCKKNRGYWKGKIEALIKKDKQQLLYIVQDYKSIHRGYWRLSYRKEGRDTGYMKFFVLCIKSRLYLTLGIGENNKWRIGKRKVGEGLDITGREPYTVSKV